MSVKKEELKSIKLTAKGKLVELDDEGFHVQDKKTEEVEVLSLEDIRNLLIDKMVSITFDNKEEFDSTTNSDEEE